MIVQGTVKQSDVTTGAQQLQLELLDGEVRNDKPLFEQAGVSFRAYPDAEVLVVEIGDSESNLAVIGTSSRGRRPTGAIEFGEGGLFYAGEYKVFLKADGRVYLGAPTATDFVALSSKVEAELTKIKSAIGGAGTTPGDGGAAFKAAIMTALNSSGMGASGSTAATRVKAV